MYTGLKRSEDEFKPSTARKTLGTMYGGPHILLGRVQADHMLPTGGKLLGCWLKTSVIYTTVSCVRKKTLPLMVPYFLILRSYVFVPKRLILESLLLDFFHGAKHDSFYVADCFFLLEMEFTGPFSHLCRFIIPSDHCPVCG